MRRDTQVGPRKLSARVGGSPPISAGALTMLAGALLLTVIAAGVAMEITDRILQRPQQVDLIAIGMSIEQVVGIRSDGGDIDVLDVYLTLAGGGEAVDISDLQVTVRNGQLRAIFSWGTTADARHFDVSALHDADGSIAAHMMSGGDLVRLRFDLDAAGIAAGNSATVSIVIAPDIGPTLREAFSTPAEWPPSRIMAFP